MASKILVPYDGSEPSEKAVEYVINTAREIPKNQRVIILLHVIHEIPVPLLDETRVHSRRTGEEVTMAEYLKETYQIMKEAAREKLDYKKSQMERAVKGHDNVSVQVRVKVGDPADRILEGAKDEGADLIVIGRTSRKGFAAMLQALGSVSRKVAERADCPVVIVQ